MGKTRVDDDASDLDAASEADRWLDEEASDARERRRWGRKREAESAQMQMMLPGMG